MSSNPNLTAQALILGSGPSNPGAHEAIAALLKDFVYEEIDSQRIDLGGRTIIGVLIAHDPAHEGAIRDEIEQGGINANLDLAMVNVESENQ